MAPTESNVMREPGDKKEAELASLPTFNSGGAFVDVAGRDALYRIMEESSRR
jgi:hypothetical protein